MAHTAARRCLPLMLLLGAAACGEGTAPRQVGPPARIDVTSGAGFSGTVGTHLATPLGVRVVDAQGYSVRGVVVRFTLVRGSGFVTPQSVATSAKGVAQATLTLGVAAGTHEVIAVVSGVPTAGRIIGSARAGSATRVVVTPGQVRLAAVGDTARLRAGLYDAHGNAVAGADVTWTAADPEGFTIDAAGLVTGTRALSVGRAIAQIGGRADTAYVVVADPDASPCLGYPAPVALAVGQSLSLSTTDGACVAASGPGEEYVVIPWNGSTTGGSRASLHVAGNGLIPVTASQSIEWAGQGLASAAGAPASKESSDPVRSFDLERRIREEGRRVVMPLAVRARRVLETRSPTAARASSIPANLVPGNVIELNANAGASCGSTTKRAGRVAAVSDRAIVVHDTLNPAGGFTDSDYQRFAATFDTLVVPVNDAAFGTPTDIDRNGRVVVFFTRAVNELTPAGAAFYYGGFFHPRDLLPKELNGASYCAGSNEGEMFYMLVPDPAGTINGNVRRVGFVDSVTIGTLAHEYQHLVNAGRRAFVNNVVVDEEVWLNEGLSHIAEELIFHRASGAGPRQNIGGERFGAARFDAAFTQFMTPNFGRLRAYLQSPQNFSPYTAAAELATRGAAWAFLRYAADRRGSGDGDTWMRLVNSTTAGIQNLQAVFGPDVLAMVRDWSVAVYADDYVSAVSPDFTQPSWNFRAAFEGPWGGPRGFPLADAVRRMSDGTAHSVMLRGGSATFLRFAVPAGGAAAIRLTSDGLVPPATIQATIVRRQ